MSSFTSNNFNDDVRDDAQPNNDNDVEIEPAVDLDNPFYLLSLRWFFPWRGKRDAAK